MGLGAKLVGVVVVAIVLALAWSVVAWLLSALWLGFKIAVVLAAVVLVLTAVGWIRVNIFKR